jgi:hypothetical protein
VKEIADSSRFSQMFDFKHVRDYEIATSRHLHQEYIFCFEDGQDDEALAAAAADAAGAEKPPAAKRPRGAYFSRLEEAQTLRKRRPRVSRCLPARLPKSRADRALLT